MKTKQYLRTIFVVACFAVIGHAAAHAHPKTEVPADGATVAAPPEVSIVFDDALEPAFSSITVSDAQGHPVTTAKAELDAVTHKNLHVSLPALAPGAYQVKWVAVSVDGHRTNGAYRFTVK
jgi:methionine-rich copper-binding protein CopC